MEVVITVLDDVTEYKKKKSKASRPGFYKFMGCWV